MAAAQEITEQEFREIFGIESSNLDDSDSSDEEFEGFVIDVDENQSSGEETDGESNDENEAALLPMTFSSLNSSFLMY